MPKYLMIFALMVTGNQLCAESGMADDFRGEGKIFIVIAIILVILAGFFFLLFKLDKRSKRLEKEIRERQE